jgi:4-alpha-glucanotransferase
MRNSLLLRRRAGVLCHLTSLPGPGRTGVIGDDAFRFLDFVQAAGLTIWQLLPLNPPDSVGSPYHSESAFAIDTRLIDWTRIGEHDARKLAEQDGTDFAEFRERHSFWLDDYATFSIARAQQESPWWEWPAALRAHDPDVLRQFRAANAAEFETIVARQFVAFRSWQALRQAAAERDITVIGDMPLYPAADSAEVWSHAELFQLDRDGRMTYVAGVPPDYFSKTGQLWGNPVFDWDRMQDTGFTWWIERVRTQLALFDIVRIDHFLGLESYWKVTAGAETAEHGERCTAPGAALLARLRRVFDPLPLIAEDLGTVTKAAEALRDRFELPGMRVLQFGFSGDQDNPHEPGAIVPECVAYTGTHDNDTTLGWYRDQDDDVRANIEAVLGDDPDMPWALIRLVFESPANTAIVPMQDFLGLDSSARMNVPGKGSGNWAWRFQWDQVSPGLAPRIRALARDTGRA